MSKQNLTFLITTLVAVILLATGNYLYKNTSKINALNAYITSNCSMSENFCLSLQNALRPLLSLGYEVEIQKISKEVLPSIHIYLSDAALRKINNKRNDTLEKIIPILLTDKNDWVKGNLVADDGQSKKEVPVSLRLKGDWGDHLLTPSKLSFRIDPKDNETVMGMSRFSIQHPGTRYFYFEPMIMNQMRQRGVLTPRYFFARVWINDYPIGVMALEEHFTKELLESQGRREGSILGFDEDPIWHQRHLNHNTHKNHQFLVRNGINRGYTTHQLIDLSLKDYRKVTHVSNDLPSTQSNLGQSLLNDYLKGSIGASQVFDLQQISSWWVISHMWGACHGLVDHNRRFYFNTITNKLEPIAFDSSPEPSKFKMCADELHTTKLFTDSNFLEYLYSELEWWANLLYDEKYIDDFEQEKQHYKTLLDIEGLEYPDTNVHVLRSNLSKLIENVVKIIPEHEADDGKLSKLDDISYKVFLEGDIDFYMPLRSHVYFDNPSNRDELTIELKNLTLDKIRIKEIYYQHSNSNNHEVLDKDFFIDTFNEENPEANTHKTTRTIRWHTNYPQKSELRISYQLKDKSYDQLIPLQHRNHDFSFSNLLENTNEVSSKIIIQENQQNIIFPPARYVFNKNYSLPKGWSMLVLPGSELVFEGVSLRLQGELNMVGDLDNPIHINVKTNTTFKGIGIWGGIHVVQSDKLSRLEHVYVHGNDANLANRQDYFGLTGCLNFYESDVEIYQSHFKNAQCEDALNIVRSTYHLNQIHIDSSRADAFDSDFSEGTITNSHFTNIGNDGVDISGTTLELNDSFFTAIGDKAISVGEKSQLISDNLLIKQTSTGVASKDLSTAKLSNISFEDVKGTGLITYIKKPEYGPASITCGNCTFINTAETYANQSYSTITLDDKNTGIQNFTHKQMLEIGYIEQ